MLLKDIVVSKGFIETKKVYVYTVEVFVKWEYNGKEHCILGGTHGLNYVS